MEIKSERKEEDALFFNIWVTTSCNYVCSYCYEGIQKKESFLDVCTADQVIWFMLDTAKVRGVDFLKINFHGGEPTLNFSIIEYIINELRKNGSVQFFTSMTTNCSLFQEKAINLLDEISVSIDGNKITHDRNRKLKDGQGTFDESFQNALLYSKVHSNVKINMVVTASSARELYDNVMFFIHSGFRNIAPSIDYFDPNWSKELFDILYIQLKKIKGEIHTHGLDDMQIGMFNQLISEKGRCIVGKTHFQINTDGGLYPCTVVVGDSAYCFGNVKTGIDEQKVEQMNQLMDPEVSECADCIYYSCCMTCRCYFINEKLTGSMYSPSGVICAKEHLKMKLKRI